MESKFLDKISTKKKLNHFDELKILQEIKCNTLTIQEAVSATKNKMSCGLAQKLFSLCLIDEEKNCVAENIPQDAMFGLTNPKLMLLLVEKDFLNFEQIDYTSLWRNKSLSLNDQAYWEAKLVIAYIDEASKTASELSTIDNLTKEQKNRLDQAKVTSSMFIADYSRAKQTLEAYSKGNPIIFDEDNEEYFTPPAPYHQTLVDRQVVLDEEKE